MVYILILVAIGFCGFYLVLLGRGIFTVPDSWSGRGLVMACGIFFIVGAFLTGVIWLLDNTPTPQMALEKLGRKIFANADAALIVWHRELPDTLHGGITITNIYAANGRIIYDAVLPTSSSEDFLKMAQSIEDSLSKSACTDPEYKTNLWLRLPIQINFHAGSDNAWGAKPFLITPAMCGY